MPGSGIGFAVLEVFVFALAGALFCYSFYVKIMLMRTGARFGVLLQGASLPARRWMVAGGDPLHRALQFVILTALALFFSAFSSPTPGQRVRIRSVCHWQSSRRRLTRFSPPVAWANEGAGWSHLVYVIPNFAALNVISLCGPRPATFRPACVRQLDLYHPLRNRRPGCRKHWSLSAGELEVNRLTRILSAWNSLACACIGVRRSAVVSPSVTWILGGGPETANGVIRSVT